MQQSKTIAEVTFLDFEKVIKGNYSISFCAVCIKLPINKKNVKTYSQTLVNGGTILSLLT